MPLLPLLSLLPPEGGPSGSSGNNPSSDCYFGDVGERVKWRSFSLSVNVTGGGTDDNGSEHTYSGAVAKVWTRKNYDRQKSAEDNFAELAEDEFLIYGDCCREAHYDSETSAYLRFGNTAVSPSQLVMDLNASPYDTALSWSIVHNPGTPEESTESGETALAWGFELPEITWLSLEVALAVIWAGPLAYDPNCSGLASSGFPSFWSPGELVWDLTTSNSETRNVVISGAGGGDGSCGDISTTYAFNASVGI